MNVQTKLFTIVSICFISFLGFFSCSDDDDSDLLGNWIRRSDFGGTLRSDASCIVIGRKAYVIAGYNGKQRLKDVWEYDIDRGYWTQKADLPAAGRSSAFAFASEDRGYFGTGYDGNNYYNDFWEYNPNNNEWLKRADFPGAERYGATAFYLNGVGYAGTGTGSNYYLDFYKYDPATDTWETGVSIQGSKRAFATNFIIDNKAYVVGGVNNGGYVYDFWMFDPETQTWQEKAYITNRTDDDFDDDYTSIARANTVAFVINGYGYLATGDFSGLNSNTWEYNPTTDRWVERTSFEGSARTAAVGFAIDDRAFVLTGRGSTTQTTLYFDDMWELRPRDEYNEYD